MQKIGKSEPAGQLTLLRIDGVGEPTDTDLCGAFLTGDESAFGFLVRRHQSLVYALVRRYAPQPEDARDLAQRAFLKAFQAARRAFPRFSSEQEFPFKAWLARIAINLGKNHARQQRRWRFGDLAAVDNREASGPSAVDVLEQDERARFARAAVLRLPRRQREVLVLRVDADMPFAEIAQTLGITANNAKVHFHHAVQRLKVAVAESVGEKS